MTKEVNNIILSVILPMFNEEVNISRNLKSVLKALRTLSVSWELLLINDGSSDKSEDEAKKTLEGINNAHIISYEFNRGRGFALRKGFEAASGKYIITTESDLSWGADIIPKIYHAIASNSSDAVIVSPYIIKEGLKNVPFKRRFLSKFGNKILTFGLPGNLTMVTGMTRGYKRSILNRIILQEDGKDIHLEIISKLIGIGAKIEEIPGRIVWDKETRKTRKNNMKTKQLILSHLYFSIVEAPIHFIGLLGIILIILGLLGATAIVVFKIIGYSLRNIIFFPHYVFVCLLMGIMIFIFALLSSQITKLEKELIKVYAKIMELKNKD